MRRQAAILWTLLYVFSLAAVEVDDENLLGMRTQETVLKLFCINPLMRVGESHTHYDMRMSL